MTPYKFNNDKSSPSPLGLSFLPRAHNIDCNDITIYRKALTMSSDKTIQTLSLFHELDAISRNALAGLDKKIEEADTDTVPCRVDVLANLRTLIEIQRKNINELVEQALIVNDRLEAIMTAHGIRTN